MSIWCNFFLKEQSSIAEGMEELLLIGVQDLSVIEADEVFFCGRMGQELPSSFCHIKRCEKIEEQINWQEQWELFCPYYKEGMCRVPLSNFSSHFKGELLLKAGGGFGDLSHPTTELVLEQLEGKVENKIVADIGCGSGVLGLFALLLGASKVFAIDIDPAALEHTKENAKLNQLEVTIGTSLVQGCEVDVVLLNMTFEEQKEAIASLPVGFIAKLWITAGILEEQLQKYQMFMEQKGFTCIEVVRKESWVCCLFNQHQPVASL